MFFLNPEGASISGRTYLLELGTEPVDLYLLSTNTTVGAVTPTVDAGSLGATGRTASLRRATAHHHQVDAFPLVAAAAESVAAPRRPTREGDSYVFRNVWRGAGRSDAIATARRVVTDGTVAFVLWVEDTEWGCATCYTKAHVDAMADAFLQPGADNDVYDWLTAAFGAPWGPHDRPGILIPASSAGEIHMLLANIGPGGYFSTINTIMRQLSPDSAERLLFHVASRTTPNRVKTMQWMRLSIGTMAHEFQHLITHYQKRVLHDVPMPSWLDETISEVAGELVARKIEDSGREAEARSPGWTQDYEVTGPGTFYNILTAFGIYLALNYGGVQVMQDIVQNAQGGEDAIEAALDAHGHEAVNFEDVLMNWAVATVLWDKPEVPLPYRYAEGPWSMSEAGGLTFRIDSPNLYLRDSHDMLSVAAFNAQGSQPPHSNRFACAKGVSGTIRLRVDAAPGNRITVVVKQF